VQCWCYTIDLSIDFSLLYNVLVLHKNYTPSEAGSGVNWADFMAAQGAFGTDFYGRSILRAKHRAYYCSGRPNSLRSKPRTEYRLNRSGILMGKLKTTNYWPFMKWKTIVLPDLKIIRLCYEEIKLGDSFIPP